MSKIDLFEKIIIDGKEVSLVSLESNNGKYRLEEGKTSADVQIVLKDMSKIPSGIFNENSSLKEISIPKSVKTIEDRAFAGSYNMTYVSGIENVSTIGEGSFAGTYIPQETMDVIEQKNPDGVVNFIDTIEELSTIGEKESIKISYTNVINNYGSSQKYFENITVTYCDINQNVLLKAINIIKLDNITVSGEKSSGLNGKITFASDKLILQNISVGEDSTIYNAFEGYQKLNDANYKGISYVYVTNVDIDCPSITHNIINIYTPADNAKIIIKNSTFNLTVDNSNVLRISNYMNSDNVEVIFDNVDWNYEEGLTTNDWGWAGLIIYQPAGQDVSLTGNDEHMKTWKFKFNNCRYNGVKVTANNFGEHNQVFYRYNCNKSNEVWETSGIYQLSFDGVDVPVNDGIDENASYKLGDKFTMPLIYTERSGQKRQQRIGECQIEIVEIDETVDGSDQYKLKVEVKSINITNPLSNVEIDYEGEIVNHLFYTQDTFITGDIDMFSGLEGWIEGESGIDAFLAMKGEGDTYQPELENTMGVTDYALRKLSNDLTPDAE